MVKLRQAAFRGGLGRMNFFVMLFFFCVLLLIMFSVVLLRVQALSNPRHCLWKIEGRTNQVYLFGTILFSNTNFFPLPKVVEDAYRQSHVIMFEFDMDEGISSEA